MNKNYNDVNVIVNDEFSENVFVCPICGRTFKGFGNNPYPVAEGTCCDECNQTVVMMRRKLRFMKDSIKSAVMNISRENPISGFYNEEFAVGIFRSRKNKLEVMVLSNGYQYEKEVQSTIQNYIDNNCNDKVLYNIPFYTTSMAKKTLAPYLSECDIYNS